VHVKAKPKLVSPAITTAKTSVSDLQAKLGEYNHTKIAHTPRIPQETSELRICLPLSGTCATLGTCFYFTLGYF